MGSGFEEVFLHGGDGGRWERFAAGWGGDDGQELEFGDGGARDIDALGVRAGVRWSEVQAHVLDEVVGEGDVNRGEAFELVA